MAFPIAMVAIAAIQAKMAADQQAAQAQQTAAAQAAQNTGDATSLEMAPSFQEAGTSPGAAKSANGRTLEDLNNNQIEMLPPEAEMPDTAGLLEPSFLSQSQNIPDLGVEGMPQQGSVYDSQPPPQEGGGSEASGLTSMEIAQLGLTLGSQAFKRQPGPRPPGLPGSSFSPMRPVFRG